MGLKMKSRLIVICLVVASSTWACGSLSKINPRHTKDSPGSSSTPNPVPNATPSPESNATPSPESNATPSPESNATPGPGSNATPGPGPSPTPLATNPHDPEGVCAKERQWLLAHGLIDEDENKLYTALNEGPRYTDRNDRNSRIEGWYACELISNVLKPLQP